MIASGRQVRVGRELLGMSQAELAAAAGVAPALIVRVEASDGMPMLRRADARAIQTALETAGVEFASENGTAGVRLRKVAKDLGSPK